MDPRRRAVYTLKITEVHPKIVHTPAVVVNDVTIAHDESDPRYDPVLAAKFDTAHVSATPDSVSETSTVSATEADDTDAAGANRQMVTDGFRQEKAAQFVAAQRACSRPGHGPKLYHSLPPILAFSSERLWQQVYRSVSMTTAASSTGSSPSYAITSPGVSSLSSTTLKQLGMSRGRSPAAAASISDTLHTTSSCINDALCHNDLLLTMAKRLNDAAARSSRVGGGVAAAATPGSGDGIDTTGHRSATQSVPTSGGRLESDGAEMGLQRAVQTDGPPYHDLDDTDMVTVDDVRESTSAISISSGDSQECFSMQDTEAGNGHATMVSEQEPSTASSGESGTSQSTDQLCSVRLGPCENSKTDRCDVDDAGDLVTDNKCDASDEVVSGEQSSTAGSSDEDLPPANSGLDCLDMARSGVTQNLFAECLRTSSDDYDLPSSDGAVCHHAMAERESFANTRTRSSPTSSKPIDHSSTDAIEDSSFHSSIDEDDAESVDSKECIVAAEQESLVGKSSLDCLTTSKLVARSSDVAVTSWCSAEGRSSSCVGERAKIPHVVLRDVVKSGLAVMDADGTCQMYKLTPSSRVLTVDTEVEMDDARRQDVSMTRDAELGMDMEKEWNILAAATEGKQDVSPVAASLSSLTVSTVVSTTCLSPVSTSVSGTEADTTSLSTAVSNTLCMSSAATLTSQLPSAFSPFAPWLSTAEHTKMASTVSAPAAVAMATSATVASLSASTLSACESSSSSLTTADCNMVAHSVTSSAAATALSASAVSTLESKPASAECASMPSSASAVESATLHSTASEAVTTVTTATVPLLSDRVLSALESSLSSTRMASPVSAVESTTRSSTSLTDSAAVAMATTATVASLSAHVLSVFESSSSTAECTRVEPLVSAVESTLQFPTLCTNASSVAMPTTEASVSTSYSSEASLSSSVESGTVASTVSLSTPVSATACTASAVISTESWSSFASLSSSAAELSTAEEADESTLSAENAATAYHDMQLSTNASDSADSVDCTQRTPLPSLSESSVGDEDHDRGDCLSSRAADDSTLPTVAAVPQSPICSVGIFTESESETMSRKPCDVSEPKGSETSRNESEVVDSDPADMDVAGCDVLSADEGNVKASTTTCDSDPADTDLLRLPRSTSSTITATSDGFCNPPSAFVPASQSEKTISQQIIVSSSPSASPGISWLDSLSSGAAAEISAVPQPLTCPVGSLRQLLASAKHSHPFFVHVVTPSPIATSSSTVAVASSSSRVPQTTYSSHNSSINTLAVIAPRAVKDSSASTDNAPASVSASIRPVDAPSPKTSVGAIKVRSLLQSQDELLDERICGADAADGRRKSADGQTEHQRSSLSSLDGRGGITANDGGSLPSLVGPRTAIANESGYRLVRAAANSRDHWAIPKTSLDRNYSQPHSLHTAGHGSQPGDWQITLRPSTQPGAQPTASVTAQCGTQPHDLKIMLQPGPQPPVLTDRSNYSVSLRSRGHHGHQPSHFISRTSHTGLSATVAYLMFF